ADCDYNAAGWSGSTWRFHSGFKTPDWNHQRPDHSTPILGQALSSTRPWFGAAQALTVLDGFMHFKHPETANGANQHS
ncbi:hypothetical protein ACFFP0_26705, partial [Rhizobium puerariae]